MSLNAQRLLSLYDKLRDLPLKLLDVIPSLHGSSVTTSIPSRENEPIKFNASGVELTIDEITPLVEKSIVALKVVDRILSCPFCHNTSLRLKIYCPYCGSIDVILTRIVQHTLCGYTGLEIEFSRLEWRCPGCNTSVRKDVDLAIVGKTFYCNACGKRITRPLLKLSCLSCGNEFDVEDAKSIPVYSVSLTEEGVEAKLMAVDLLVGSLRAFEDRGEYCEVLPKIGDRLVSGIGGGTCIDVADMVTESSAIEFSAKASDVRGRCSSYVVVARKFSGRSRSILALAGVKAFEVFKASEAYAMFSKEVK